MTIDIAVYIEHKIAIFSIECPKSINTPKTAVAKAVEKTISEPVKALIDPK